MLDLLLLAETAIESVCILQVSNLLLKHVGYLGYLNASEVESQIYSSAFTFNIQVDRQVHCHLNVSGTLCQSTVAASPAQIHKL